MVNLAISLDLSTSIRNGNLTYQILTIELATGDRIIAPDDLINIELPQNIDHTGGVVVNGRGPIWLYSYLVHELHSVAWIGINDPRLGAIVIASHSHQVKLGQVIKLSSSEVSTLGPALMIVGPPDSGKSVFSHTLFQTLLKINPEIYLQRANWDGEGNYILELGNDADPEIFKAANKGGLTPNFFTYHAQAILALRQQKRLVIVDVGGMIQPEKTPILEACTHYLIISSKPEVVAHWHEFCQVRGNLKPVGVIHSVLTETLDVKQTQPYPEITCGAWVRGNSCPIPDVLLEKVIPLMGK